MTTWDAAAAAVDYRLRIEAARARVNQARIALTAPPGALPPVDELLRDALDVLGGLPAAADTRRKRASTMVAAAADVDGSPLTEREAQIVSLLAAGHSGPAAAAVLGISPNTVKEHLRRVKERTGLKSGVLIATAVREGWVE